MNDSSQKPSAARASLALEPDPRTRLGERRYRLLKLWIRDVNGALEEALAPHVRDDSRVLDAGCSRGDPDIPSLQRAQQAVGIDVDLAGLRGNALLRDRVQGVLEVLPFEDDTFDAVVCKFVVEHLPEPPAAFNEFRRVLRPGGVLVVLTPNRWSIFVLVSGLIPYRIKRLLKASLFGGYEEDSFPTQYRANTVRHLRGMMADTGFECVYIRLLAGMWAFLIFCGPLARLARACERVQARIPLCRQGCTHILAVWRKSPICAML
jgi:SAM-dependent methyltransferase